MKHPKVALATLFFAIAIMSVSSYLVYRYMRRWACMRIIHDQIIEQSKQHKEQLLACGIDQNSELVQLVDGRREFACSALDKKKYTWLIADRKSYDKSTLHQLHVLNKTLLQLYRDDVQSMQAGSYACSAQQCHVTRDTLIRLLVALDELERQQVSHENSSAADVRARIMRMRDVGLVCATGHMQRIAERNDIKNKQSLIAAMRAVSQLERML